MSRTRSDWIKLAALPVLAAALIALPRMFSNQVTPST